MTSKNPKGPKNRRQRPSSTSTSGRASQSKKQGSKARATPLAASRGTRSRPKRAPSTPGSTPVERTSPAPVERTSPPAPDWAPEDTTWEHAEEEAPASSERSGTNQTEASPDSGDFGMLGIGTRVLPPEMEYELFDDESSPLHPAPAIDPETVAERIRDLEARLDGMMTTVSPSRTAPARDDGTDHGADTERELDEAGAVEAARELLQSDYYRRKWGRASLRGQVEEVDDFGLAPEFEQQLRPLLKFLFRRYFRVETRGIDNIPADGRAVIVANHSGTLPLDGVMLREALREHHPASRDLRWLAEDFIFYLPFIGVAMNRIGAVRACQENAQRLLSKEHLIAVFPEGTKGIKKLYRQRYQLQRFGRGGYIRLCLRTQSPLIPCAIVGAEETNPMLYRLDNFSRLFGLQYLPITPTFPWLGPLGLVPAPTKWRITFGEPIALDGYGTEAADDHVLIGRLSERVRASISSMLEGSLRSRRSVWL